MDDIIFDNLLVFEKEIVKDEEEDTGAKLIRKAVNKIAFEHGFREFKTRTKNLSFDGASFLSRLCTIDIIDLETEKEINLFFKNLIVIDKSINLFPIEDTYERESFFYNSLAIQFDELQNEFNLPEKDIYRLVKSYDSETNAMIIMENLLRQGYESPDRMEIPSLDFVKKSIKELAKFKALSMALEKYRSAYFEEKIKPLDHLYKPDEKIIQIATKLLKEDIKLQRNEKVRERLAKRVPILYAHFLELFHGQDATCGLTHNDYRPSNSLIKSENGKIIDYINVDYQFMCYTNIINDFLLFIFMSTDREFRNKHLKYIKNYFHDNMAKFLNYYGIHIDDVYPKEVFEKEYKDKLEIGLTGALLMLPVLLARLDDLPDFTKPIDDCFSTKRSAEYVRRINDIGEEFLEWGIL